MLRTTWPRKDLIGATNSTTLASACASVLRSPRECDMLAPMRVDYRLDERLPFFKSLLLGLQWAVIAASVGIILGKVAASVHYGQLEEQILYLQKLFFVTAVNVLLQVLWGHRLPVISGAAVIALLGVTASQSSSPETVYTAVMVGGVTVGER